MNDMQLQKLYAPEVFAWQCPKCDLYAEDHDEETGKCLVDLVEERNEFIAYIDTLNEYKRKGLVTESEYNRLIARKWHWVKLGL